MASALSLKPKGLTFSWLGLVQGLIWFIMSILGILIYRAVLFDDPFYFINKPTLALIVAYIRGFEKILILLIVYCILSFGWAVVSWQQQRLLRSTRSENQLGREVFEDTKLSKLKNVLRQWISLTIAISVVDVVTVGIVAQDYSDLNEINTIIGMNVLDMTGMKIILAVAARGVVIWIINVAGIIICSRLLKQVQQQEAIQLLQDIQSCVIQPYQPSQPYSPVEASPVSHVNPSFIEDENKDNDMTNIQSIQIREVTLVTYKSPQNNLETM